MSDRYDTIGRGYTLTRREDPRIAAAIHAALQSARSVVNVGAGAGAYEPRDRRVIAVEPSCEMIAQRPIDAAEAIQASAERLPFADDAFDAAMAVLTVHHWQNKPAGLAEMRRVASGPIVIVTFDPAARPWLTHYLPELAEIDQRQMPAMSDYAKWLGPVRIEPIPVPHDCIDGFLYAFWRRPGAYLDAKLRAGSSSFHAISTEGGLRKLAADLDDGTWEARYGELLLQDSYDAGYRLVIAG